MPADGNHDGESHWVRWHEPYEDPASALSVRLALVQSMVGAVLDAAGPGPIRVVSLCAGQGRDVIEVVAGHRRAGDVSALLVELDPALVASARARAAAAGVSSQVSVVQGDASLGHHYAGSVPADLVLVCGVFGNISDADIAATVGALPGFCAPGASVVWTRHRRPPDATPGIRRLFTAAGFEEVAFEAPPGPYVMSVGRHRLVGAPGRFDPGLKLFTFVGKGYLPA
ncbi:MAG TPA: class I SAM-dependent methyltransferase family protein [Acidimicrobiales bacterium]|nr:class I SAM-dependent methyltransferase family protein [Acidimicrobiales bacterium]